VHVLFAITNGDVGGAQEHVRILMRGLLQRGHHVSILVRTPSPLAASIESTGVDIIPWTDIVRNPHPVRDVRARQAMRRVVQDLAPDVLHVHSAKAGVLGRGLWTPPKGVTIFTCHHLSFGPGRKVSHRIVGRPIEQVSLPLVDGIITVGTRDMPTLRRLAPGVPIQLVRNAVPQRTILPIGDKPGHEALWVARMQHPKDPVQLVKAWELVHRQLPDARLTFCGGGPLEDELRAAIAKSTARDAIEYPGAVPDLAPYQARAHLFVLASSVEGGTTMATLEAMSAGLVPVLSDVGDAYRVMSADAGVVAYPGSSKALGNAIVDAFTDRARLAAMSENAVALTREWTVDDMIDTTVAFYERVLTRSMLSVRR
jgi:glycosyltransferase involved in cell wall biosynthesis